MATMDPAPRHVDRAGMRAKSPGPPDPDPVALPGPVAGHPVVAGAGRGNDDLVLGGRWSLTDHNIDRGRAGLRRGAEVNDTSVDTPGEDRRQTQRDERKTKNRLFHT